MSLNVAGTLTQFHTSVSLFRRYQVRTRVAGWGTSWFYVLHHVQSTDSRSTAVAGTRLGFTRGGALIPTADITAQLAPGLLASDEPEWAKAWAYAEHALNEQARLDAVLRQLALPRPSDPSITQTACAAL